jgi:hypothetical protein
MEWFARGIRLGAATAFALGWIASCLPSYRYGHYQDYFVRLHPLIVWFTFVSALTFILAWGQKYGFNWLYLRAYKKTIGIALVVMTIFILIWILIASSGLGLRISEDYWYGTGVPILVLQVVFAFTIGICFYLLERASFSARMPPGIEIFIFIFIWGVVAFLWAREPMPSSYFAPGPYLPDYQFHPYSDAVVFDLASQFALIGQEINNGAFFDRALYMGFLVFLHALAGQDYTQVVALQAALYAVFPGILYLLGKEIHSRTFGVTLAVLAVLRGLNGIAASSMIDLANQKQMLTDFPIAILMAWLTLMMVKWLKAPNKNYTHALWVGGIAGLAVMLRTHALFALLFALLMGVIIYWQQRSRILIVSLFLVTAMFASILPWGIASGGSVMDVFMFRIRTVIQQRYSPNPPPPTATPSPQGSQPSSLGLVSWEQGSIPANPPSSFKPPSQLNFGSISDQLNFYEIKRLPLPISITTNFFHNLVTSVFILPASPVFLDLRHTLKESTPFWEQYWDGTMGTGCVLVFILNMALIALGISVAWRSVKLPGLVPLGIFFFYNLANALARTSGGRYIVPVDWVVFLYFALGLLQVIFWIMTLFGSTNNYDQAAADDQSSWNWVPLKKAPMIILFFLFIGSTLPLSEMIFPKRYPPRSQADLFVVLESEGYLNQMGFDPAALKDFSEQWPAFRVVEGRALYPRFYLQNKGESKRQYPYQILGFPRIGFTMIGPNGTNYVVLPKNEVSYFPNASDVIVLGCQDGEKIDALAVVFQLAGRLPASLEINTQRQLSA